MKFLKTFCLLIVLLASTSITILLYCVYQAITVQYIYSPLKTHDAIKLRGIEVFSKVKNS